MWQDFTEGNLDLCLKEEGDFFLVRPKGLHPSRGGKFTPSIVQILEGKLYVCEDELHPIIFSHRDDFLTPSDNPFNCNLEWHELPE